MSPLPVRMIPKKEVVLNSVAEFLGIWAVRGEASPSLKTKDGVTTIAFHHTLSGGRELARPPLEGGGRRLPPLLAPGELGALGGLVDVHLERRGEARRGECVGL